MTAALSPTRRTSLTRHRERGSGDRADLFALYAGAKTGVPYPVLARASFSHSMNYRSAVVMGPARRVDDATEQDHALSLIVDHVVPGRSATLRANTRKELAATVVLAMPLAEASVKARTGGPADEPEDVAAGVWAGVVPLSITAGEIEPDHAGPVPDDVRRRVADWSPR